MDPQLPSHSSNGHPLKLGLLHRLPSLLVQKRRPPRRCDDPQPGYVRTFDCRIYRRNLDGSEPRYYLSNAPEDTPLETLAYVGGSRWRIETEFETEKSDVGPDEYETRTWAGWHHHVALCLLGRVFLLSLQ